MQVKRIVKFMIIIYFVFSLAVPAAGVMADTQASLNIAEIGTDYLSGNTVEKGTLEVYQDNQLIGKANVENDFSIKFSSRISAGMLTLKFNSEILNVMYEPVVSVGKVDDEQKILTGKAVPNALVSAYINDLPLKLKQFDQTTGNFEFSPSAGIQSGTMIKLVSEKNGIKSVSIVTVATAVPDKPIVQPISNKDLYITGQANMNSTVYVKASGKIYTQTLGNTTVFKIKISPLREGTSVTAYAVNSLGRSSSMVTLTVLDKIPPPIPTINKLTDKVFAISGTTEAGATVYIKRNSSQMAVRKADKSGSYYYKMPLQKQSTVFEVYAVDSSNNKSLSRKATVTTVARQAKKLLNAPSVKQMPQLPRGCEVTSLTMLLNYTGVKVDKMTLAQQVKKDPSPYKVVNGKKYFGNPNIGFVGNMYTFSKPGFGVYNQPIKELAERYKPGRIVNLSGQSFDAVLNYVSLGHPVWVITTSTFAYVPSKYWQTWYTAQGPIRITMKEHSVLITGYDSKYIYFNDPLDGTKNKKKPLKPFTDGWKQFGNQAISYF